MFASPTPAKYNFLFSTVATLGASEAPRIGFSDSVFDVTAIATGASPKLYSPLGSVHCTVCCCSRRSVYFCSVRPFAAFTISRRAALKSTSSPEFNSASLPKRCTTASAEAANENFAFWTSKVPSVLLRTKTISLPVIVAVSVLVNVVLSVLSRVALKILVSALFSFTPVRLTSCS